MGINQLVNHTHESIFDDKKFVKQFVFLLALIMAVSLVLIYHSIHTVNDISGYHPSHSHITADIVTLDKVERNLNGHVINLEIFEDSVDDLVDLDLAQFRKNSVTSSLQKENETKKVKIQISSVDMKTNTRERKHVNSVTSIKRIFQKTHNVKYSMALAKRFYNAKKYDKALKWALISNEIDPQKEASWILFAKTKMKMGKKQDACNALNAYLKIYQSQKIARFLEKLKINS